MAPLQVRRGGCRSCPGEEACCPCCYKQACWTFSATAGSTLFCLGLVFVIVGAAANGAWAVGVGLFILCPIAIVMGVTGCICLASCQEERAPPPGIELVESARGDPVVVEAVVISTSDYLEAGRAKDGRAYDSYGRPVQRIQLMVPTTSGLYRGCSYSGRGRGGSNRLVVRGLLNPAGLAVDGARDGVDDLGRRGAHHVLPGLVVHEDEHAPGHARHPVREADGLRA